MVSTSLPGFFYAPNSKMLSADRLVTLVGNICLVIPREVSGRVGVTL